MAPVSMRTVSAFYGLNGNGFAGHSVIRRVLNVDGCVDNTGDGFIVEAFNAHSFVGRFQRQRLFRQPWFQPRQFLPSTASTAAVSQTTLSNAMESIATFPKAAVSTATISKATASAISVSTATVSHGSDFMTLVAAAAVLTRPFQR